MTFSLMYAFTENFVLPISHDEVVHGKGSLLRKMPGDHWQKLANLRAYLAFMWAPPRQAAAVHGLRSSARTPEWSEGRALDWWLLDDAEHRGSAASWSATSTRATRTRRRCGAGRPTRPASQWIDANDAADNVFSFLRYGSDGLAAGLHRRTSPAVPHENYRVGLPAPVAGREVLNTDADDYGGSGVGNLGGVDAADAGVARPAGLGARCGLPPLGTLWLRWDG